MNPTKKILILAANPKNTSRLRLDEEVREIEDGLHRAKKREQFTIHQKWAVRLRDLRRALLDYEPHIVHFCGHGEVDGIMVEDEDKNAVLVNPDALAGLFERFKNTVECVLLNACYSEQQAEAINKHIHYVIGMSQGITDKAALEFSVGFYDALGAGKSIEEAFEFGRNAIQLYNIPEHLTPILKKKLKVDIPPLKKPNSLVQLILEGEISNFNETTQNNLVNILAAILEIDKQSIKVLQVTSGSIRVILELPSESAQKLITLFNTKDEQIEQLITKFQVSAIKKIKQKPPWSRIIYSCLFAIIFGVIMFFFSWVRVFDFFTLDTLLTSYIIRIGDLPSHKVLSDTIVTIVIKDENFDTSWRKSHAILLDKLSRVGAKVIVFDMFFEKPSEFDDNFANAIKAAAIRGTAVIVGIRDFQGNEPKLVNTFQQAVSGFGSLCVGERLDQVRKIPLVIVKKDNYVYSLSLKAVESYQGGKIVYVDSENKHIILEKKDALYEQWPKIKFADQTEVRRFQKHCPAIREGDRVAEMFIDLSPDGILNNPVQSYDYRDIIEQGEFNELNRFYDKIVLVGVKTMDDSFEVYRGFQKETRYGIEIHADAINTLLNNVYVHMSPFWDITFILGFGGGGIVLGSIVSQIARFRKIWVILIFVSFALSGFLLAILFYCGGQILLNVTYYWANFIILFAIGYWGVKKLKR